jgi:hypothetical protein
LVNFNIILSSMLRYSKWFSSFRFPQQNPIRTDFYLIHATCPTHLILNDSSTWIIFDDVYKCSSSRTLLQLFVTFFPLYWNFFLSITFLITFIQCNVKDKVWHPNETIIDLCILMFKFIVSKWEGKTFWPENLEAFLVINHSLTLWRRATHIWVVPHS